MGASETKPEPSSTRLTNAWIEGYNEQATELARTKRLLSQKVEQYTEKCEQVERLQTHLDSTRLTNNWREWYSEQATELARTKRLLSQNVEQYTEKCEQVERLQTHLEQYKKYATQLVAQNASITKELQELRDSQTLQQNALTYAQSGKHAGTRKQPRFKKQYIPYLEHIRDHWFSTIITRPHNAQPAGTSLQLNIDMYNCSYRSSTVIAVIDDKLDEELNDEDTMFYHATDAGSAQHILENGIDLTKSARNVDFSSGGGFYVTDNLDKAVEWSHKVAGWMGGGKRAVIGFKIDSSLLSEEPQLWLDDDNGTDKTLWECVVSHFRHGKRSPDVANVLRDKKFIYGPVAKVKKLSDQEIPTPFLSFMQLCICDADYAKRFGSLQNISFVIFFN